MNKPVLYFWLILLLLYIVSPLDMHPLFFDDLIALGAFVYLWYRNTKQKKQRPYSYTYDQSGKEYKQTASGDNISLEGAYRLLEVSPDASWDEIKKSYKEKVVKSHPDKVNHLSKELQDKAKELTLKLNNAYDVIKRYKK
jgi:hypothetical protein